MSGNGRSWPIAVIAPTCRVSPVLGVLLTQAYPTTNTRVTGRRRACIHRGHEVSGYLSIQWSQWNAVPRFHVRLGTRRTTVLLDSVAADYLARHLAAEPGTPAPHRVVVGWLQGRIDAGMPGAGVSQWLAGEIMHATVRPELRTEHDRNAADQLDTAVSAAIAPEIMARLAEIEARLASR